MDEMKLKELINKLPINPDIHGKNEYFYSAVLVLLALINGEYHFIFEKRSSKVRQGGEICFPGGGFEPDTDNSTEETVLRETEEEVGIGRGKIKLIGRLDTQVAPLGAIVDAFVGIADISSLDELKIDHNEVEYVFTVPVSFFENNEPEKYYTLLRSHPTFVDENGTEIVSFPSKELGLPEVYTKPWGEKKHRIYLYQVQNETIWGITARFIYDLVEKLKG